MKFLWTAIYVKNLDESIAFYTNLVGLHVVKRFPAGPGMEIAFMGNGTDNETLVELLADSKKSPVNDSEFISIGFAVDSVDAMLDTVQRHNIPVHTGPIETPTGSRLSIHLVHDSQHAKQNGSPSGVRLVSSLKEFGLVNHRVWVETNNTY